MSTDTAEPRRGRWVERLFPVSIAITGLVITWGLADVLVRRELDQVRSRTAAEAKHVAAQLRAGVLQAFDPLQRIAAWWLLQGAPLAPEDWDTDAQLFVRARAGLEQVTWANPAGDHEWTLRGRPNTPADGSGDSDPLLRTTVETARRSGTVAISDVFEAKGKMRLYACFPVKRQARLVGFVAGRYDAAELIRSVLDGQLPDDYSVSVTANGREIPAIGSSSPGVWHTEIREAGTTISNSFWLVRVSPSAAEAATLRRSVFVGGVLVSMLLYLCAVVALIARRRAAQLAFTNGRLVAENRERERAEQKIRELNLGLQRRLDEFRILIDVLPVGIAVADDPECRTIRMNRSMAAMLKLPLQQNISKSVDPAEQANYRLQRDGWDVPPEELPMQVAARTGAPVANQELDIVLEDGSLVHTLSYSAPVFDESGRVRGVINACVDITEQKCAEAERRASASRERDLAQRLVQAEKYSSLALMAGGIAHDFNNLLTVIIGDASLLVYDLDPRGAGAGKLADLLTAANRAADLTARLLAFTGNIWCNTQSVNLSLQVTSAQERIREIVPARVDLQFDLASDLPLVRAGVTEIQQVIEHLVENAVEAIDGREGKIAICTTCCELTAEQIDRLFPLQHLTPGSYVVLEVIDDGCGIPEEIAGRVFDPFFSTKFVGRGLGLSAVQGIVRAHGGGVLLDSFPHRGTRVEIVFPVESAQTGDRTDSAPIHA